MLQLNGVCTQLCNKVHGRAGHLFQDREKTILIRKGSHLREVSRDVVLNPVRAKRVEMPGEYAWSGSLATAGKAKPHPCLITAWVLGQFSGKRAEAKQECRKSVQGGTGQKTLWTEMRGQMLFGEEAFVDPLVDHLKKKQGDPEIPMGIGCERSLHLGDCMIRRSAGVREANGKCHSARPERFWSVRHRLISVLSQPV